MSPAAQWGNEFRAGSKQFIDAVHRAEAEISALYRVADEKLSSPTRTPTGAPENLFDVFINFIDVLAHWLEQRQKR